MKEDDRPLVRIGAMNEKDETRTRLPNADLQFSIQESELSLIAYIKNVPNIQYESLPKPTQSALPFHPIVVNLSISSYHSTPTSDRLVEVPSEADIATHNHRTLAAVIATQHRYHLCWPKRHSMKAAGCCYCCNKAVGSAALDIGSAGWRIAAVSCRSRGRGLGVCDRESSRCHGKVGSRAFCDDGP